MNEKFKQNFQEKLFFSPSENLMQLKTQKAGKE